MKILEYDEVDPFSALNVAMLALDFPFTPEHATHLRQTDPRPFPCLTVNAVEDNLVLGQVGVFRLPMISSEGREDVGGIWAVSTHPAYSGRGIASALLDEAHNRFGVVAPFFLGWGVGLVFLPDANPLVHVFIGATLTATSVGITARVLKDIGKIETKEARIILGAAVWASQRAE